MSSTKNSNSLLEKIIYLLEESKAKDIRIINVRKKSSFADFLVITEGTSSRHVGSIVNKVSKGLKKKVLSIEGLPKAEWALIDFGDIVLHVFKPEVRHHYDLEKLWSDSIPQEKKSVG